MTDQEKIILLRDRLETLMNVFLDMGYELIDGTKARDMPEFIAAERILIKTKP